MDNSESTSKLNELIKDIKYAMLCTIDGNGQIRSRPMVTQQSKFDGDLYFFSGQHSPKIDELRNNPHVNLTYIQNENCFISVSGTAEVVKDREKMQDLWRPEYHAWFPKGLDDPELSLLKVKVIQAEYWDVTSHKLVQILNFAKAVLTGKKHEGEKKEHDKIKIAG